MQPVQALRNVHRYDGSKFKSVEDAVVTEYALTIQVNGEEFATVVCTPEYMEDMVIGFLASEGLIGSPADIEELYIQERMGFAQVSVKAFNQLRQRLRSKRYVTSCCGMARQGFYFVNDALTAKTMNDVNITLSPDEILHLMDEMQSRAELFKQTGGVHTAALCDRQDILLVRRDIGRHNALDKIYGYCLQNDIAMTGKVLVFSGRISSEILLKASKIGVEMLLSKSAATELALQMAEELGITTVGFIRNRSFNVYTHPERISGCSQGG